MAADGWNHRKAYFQDFDGKYYSVTISVAKGANGNMVYNIGNMKEEASPKVKGSSAGNGNGPRGFASSDTSIRSEWQKGQEKFSAAEDVSESDAGAEGAAAFTLDSIPKKAQYYLRRVRADGSDHPADTFDAVCGTSGDLEASHRLKRTLEAAAFPSRSSPELHCKLFFT